MARYIDASKLMRRIETEAMRWGEEYDLSQIMGDIEDFPAADVVEVKHGKWEIEVFQLSKCKEISCSECGYNEHRGPAWDDSYGFYPYCPHCGAKMDGGKTE